MKNLSLKLKIAITSAIVMLISFVVVMLLTLNIAKSKISDAMMEQLINQSSQIAKQAELLIEKDATVDELQEFVEGITEKNSYIAYAVIVDDDVTALAHSDAQKR